MTTPPASPPGKDPTLKDSDYGCALILGRQVSYFLDCF